MTSLPQQQAGAIAGRGSALLAARQIQLSFAGPQKARLYQQALSLHTPRLPLSLPLHRSASRVQVWTAP